MNRRLAFLHWLQPGAVHQLRRYYQDAMTPCRRPAALRFLRLVVPRLHSLVRSLTESAPPRPGVGNPVSPAGILPRSEQGSPKFLGNHDCPFAHVLIRRRRDYLHQTVAVQQRGPSRAQVQWLPRLGLSTLSSMAFGLAVYASQCGLHRARLASSCWSGSTGRAFHPHDSTERFQSCKLHLILLSQACLAQRACQLLRETCPRSVRPARNSEVFHRGTASQKLWFDETSRALMA
jgi:hypothetical protein